MSEKIEMIEIKRVEKETSEHYVFYFDFEKARLAKPGQFLMVWLPRIDEKPISLSKISSTEQAITIQAKGKWSKVITQLKEGDRIGLRGPYGKGFDLNEVKNAIIVAGGCGSAPLQPLVEEALSKGITTKVILGAQTADKLLFKKNLAQILGQQLFITTDDGSEGEKGFVTTILDKLLAEEKPDGVFCCGPEVMMKAVFDICEKSKVDSQCSLERYMKCGFGLCGQCMMDDLRVCKEGPVFNSDVLRESKEFGKSARLKTGKKVSLKEYSDWRQC
jgi:dihydroorotate dehydrogenase electron transfer subunit